MEKEYLSIKEYADIRGVSTTSVYKRLNTTLKEYLVMVEGKKMLKSSVLEDEGFNRVGNNGDNDFIQPASTASLAEKQLEIKDKQIEELTEQIKQLQEDSRKKDDFIQEQSKKITELLEQSHILLQNNQLLLAGKQDPEEEIIETEAEVIAVPASQDPPTPEPQEKKSWFKRLFG